MEEISRLVERARATNGSLEAKHEVFDQIVRRFQDMAYGPAYATMGDARWQNCCVSTPEYQKTEGKNRSP